MMRGREAASEVWGLRDRTGRLEPLFLTQNPQTYFLVVPRPHLVAPPDKDWSGSRHVSPSGDTEHRR